MARQRSGSSSARNSRGPGGSRPAATRPAGKSAAAKPASEPVEDEVATSAAAEPVETEPVEDPVAEVDADEADEDDDEDDAADEVDAEADEVDEDEFDEADEDDDGEADEERSAASAALWSEVRIAPVEIALPKGVGYTLRAYRLSTELAPIEVDEREDDFAEYRASHPELDDVDIELDDDEDDDDRPFAELGGGAGLRKRADDDDLDPDDELDGVEEFEDDEDDEDEDDPEAIADEDDDEDDDEARAADDEDEDDEDDAPKPVAEEVPVFLGRRGRLYLFQSPEALVEFVRSSDEHDLAQLDTWADLRERLTPEDVVPEAEDRYELDLVVDNLRGGGDAVDASLLIQAGEVARDVAYAMRLEPVIGALAAGSPLDDLDEAARAAGRGGLRAFMARRKLRRIVTQQTALGWRTIIGKISASVDWRE